MIDTIRIRAAFPRLTELALRKLGFQQIRVSPDKNHQNWGNYLGKNRPNLTYSLHYDRSFLDAEVSLPKRLYGSNVEVLHAREVSEAIELLGTDISNAVERDLNVWNARVARIDYGAAWHVGQCLFPYLRAAKSLSYPRRVRSVTDTSVYFTSSGNKMCTTLYDKESETREQQRIGMATQADVKASRGVLRLEARFKDRSACNRLAAKIGTENNVRALTAIPAALSTLENDLKCIGLDRDIESTGGRMQKLLETFGEGGIIKYGGFLMLWESRGDAVKHTISEATFYRYKRALKDAGLLAASDDMSLPALQISPLQGVRSKAA